jgi:hypothetical protein
VLGNRRRAHIEFIDELAGRPLAHREQFNNAPPRRVGDGEEALHAGID